MDGPTPPDISSRMKRLSRKFKNQQRMRFADEAPKSVESDSISEKHTKETEETEVEKTGTFLEIESHLDSMRPVGQKRKLDVFTEQSDTNSSYGEIADLITQPPEHKKVKIDDIEPVCLQSFETEKESFLRNKQEETEDTEMTDSVELQQHTSNTGPDTTVFEIDLTKLPPNGKEIPLMMLDRALPAQLNSLSSLVETLTKENANQARLLQRSGLFLYVLKFTTDNVSVPPGKRRNLSTFRPPKTEIEYTIGVCSGLDLMKKNVRHLTKIENWKTTSRFIDTMCVQQLGNTIVPLDGHSRKLPFPSAIRPSPDYGICSYLIWYNRLETVLEMSRYLSVLYANLQQHTIRIDKLRSQTKETPLEPMSSVLSIDDYDWLITSILKQHKNVLFSPLLLADSGGKINIGQRSNKETGDMFVTRFKQTTDRTPTLSLLKEYTRLKEIFLSKNKEPTVGKFLTEVVLSIGVQWRNTIKMFVVDISKFHPIYNFEGKMIVFSPCAHSAAFLIKDCLEAEVLYQLAQPNKPNAATYRQNLSDTLVRKFTIEWIKHLIVKGELSAHFDLLSHMTCRHITLTDREKRGGLSNFLKTAKPQKKFADLLHDVETFAHQKEIDFFVKIGDEVSF